jgi:hypothetical protein
MALVSARSIIEREAAPGSPRARWFWEFALNRVDQPGRCASEGVSAVTRLGTPDLERYYRRTKAAVCPQAAGRMIGLWTAR